MSRFPERHPHLVGQPTGGSANKLRHSVFRYRKVCIGASILAVFSAVVGAVTVSEFAPTDCRRCEESGASNPATDSLHPTFEQAVANAIPSVVKLDSDPDRPSTVGSGIVLTADGLILTSRHVLPGSVGNVRAGSFGALFATFADGHIAPLTIVGTDPATDVAVVRAEGVSGCRPVTLGLTADLRVGQRVAAVGSPLGLENSVTSGIVSALHRPIPIAVDGAGRITVLDTIQTDAATSFGSSGGALIDSSGALIGVNSLIGTRGVGFALPIGPAIRIANELIGTGTASHAFLGVQVMSDNETRGAKVIRTPPDSPAAAAGLEPGTVITGIDGRVITGAEALVAAVLSHAPGDIVTATYLDAAGSRQTSVIVLASDRDWSTADAPDHPLGTSEPGPGILAAEPTWLV